MKGDEKPETEWTGYGVNGSKRKSVPLVIIMTTYIVGLDRCSLSLLSSINIFPLFGDDDDGDEKVVRLRSFL